MKLLLFSFAMLGLALPLSRAETRFQSGPQHTALVELYTSEGCSSCPPAETWLSRLKEKPTLWKEFVPVAFHVDYWDRLGWRDRFSSPQWTERQRRYAALWRNESVYTPAVVINGREQRSWSSAGLSQPNDKGGGVLSASTSDGKTFEVAYRPEKDGATVWEVQIAILASGITTNVRAGENSGRNLAHDFVVLDLQNAELKSDSGAERARLTIKAPADAGGRPAVAIWVTPRGQLAPVQATGGWLR